MTDTNEPQSRTGPSSRRRKTHLLYWANITPLICGALSPISILLGLSGCADPWRVMKLPDASYDSEKNPQWVVATTASAVVIAFTANILLLMRITGRGNPYPMQFWTVILWILECRQLICSLTFSGDNVDDDWLLCPACRG